MTKGQQWLREEDADLLRMRDGERLDWPAISAQLPGRSAAACEQRYYGKLKDVRNRTRRPRGPKPSEPVVSWRKRGAAIGGVVTDSVPPSAPVVLPPVPERTRMPLLDHLRERAELQARIERQGLTAAYFGDPPPGRSALDQRANGLAAPLQPSLPGGGSNVR